MGNLGWSVENSAYQNCQILFSEINSSPEPNSVTSLPCFCGPVNFAVCYLCPIPYQRNFSWGSKRVPISQGTDTWGSSVGLDFEVWCCKHPSLCGPHKERDEKQTAVNRTSESLQTCGF